MITGSEINSASKPELSIKTIKSLGRYIVNTSQLADIAEICDFIKTIYQQPQHEEIIAKLGIDAVMRLSMEDPTIAQATFKLLLTQLPQASKKWLFLTLQLEQSLPQYQIDNEILKDPDSNLSEKLNIGKLITLFLHWSQLHSHFKASLNEALSTIPSEGEKLLDNMEHKLKVYTEKRIHQDMLPFVATHFSFKPAHYWELMRELQLLSNEQLAWYYCAICTLENDIYRDFLPLPETGLHLQQLVTKFGKEVLLFGLKEKLKKAQFQTPFKLTEEYYLNAIKAISLEAKQWLFLSMLFDDFEDEHKFTAKLSTAELKLCQHYKEITQGSPMLWRQVSKLLLNNLNKTESALLISYIEDYFNSNSNHLSDEMRLWLYLAVTTGSRPICFDVINNAEHAGSATAIRECQHTDLVDIYLRLAPYSSYLRELITSSLLSKQQSDSQFATKVMQLPLYLKHQLQLNLSVCDENTLSWLYFTLAMNIQSLQPIQCSGNLKFQLPQVAWFVMADCHKA